MKQHQPALSRLPGLSENKKQKEKNKTKKKPSLSPSPPVSYIKPSPPITAPHNINTYSCIFSRIAILKHQHNFSIPNSNTLFYLAAVAFVSGGE
jgi:hypothetical protein